MKPRSLAAWVVLLPLLALLLPLGGEANGPARSQGVPLLQQGLAAEAGESKEQPARPLLRLASERLTLEKPRRYGDLRPADRGAGGDPLALLPGGGQAGAWLLPLALAPCREAPPSLRDATLVGGGPRAPPAV